MKRIGIIGLDDMVVGLSRNLLKDLAANRIQNSDYRSQPTDFSICAIVLASTALVRAT